MKALDANATLEGALATLQQSQSNLKAAYGVFYPQVDASLQATRQKTQPSTFGVNVPASIFSVITLSGTVTYALDVFGGARREAEELKALVDYQHNTVLATYLTLTGNIVNVIIARAAYQAEINVTQEAIRLQKEQVSISQARVKAGNAAYSEMLTLQSQLSAIEATLPPLHQKLDQTKHLLATLSGQTPASFVAPEIRLAELILPEDLPLSLPSELVRQRPDILQSEALLHSASAEVGVRTAALYPSFTLNGSYGLTHTNPGDFFNGHGHGSIWDLGANITAPIFHGGTLRAQKQAAVDAYQASFASYRQTVLSAFQQVADILRGLEHDAEEVQAQALAVKSAKEAMQLIMTNYEAGTANYLQVLVANNQYYQAEIGNAQAIAQRYQDTVALFIALGGGWWQAKNQPLPLQLKARS
jgi:NodT family efflux transporter outer membrane factor (OMF) lipoprotein